MEVSSRTPVVNGGAVATILCCECGVLIAPNPSNTCPTCLAARTDVTRGISTEVQLHQCRGCQRWHKDAGTWIACDLESRELMALCLGSVPGLGNKQRKKASNEERVRLVDASWIWTEPHSMRLKVRVTVQKEVYGGGGGGTILQQSFVVTFVVRNQQCVECQSEFRQGSWKSLVQVRQRVKHKRTFLYLEQLILKHGAHRGCLSIETFRDGMDFYFPDRSKAARFVSFVENVVPIKVKASKKLIGVDDKSNVSNYKYTHLVEICAICKDDLLFLPKKVANDLGNISRCVLVKNVSNVVHLVDPSTGQTAAMNAEVYWRDPVAFRPVVVAARSRFARFVVLDREAAAVERRNVSRRATSRRNRSRLAKLTLAREADLGVNDDRTEQNSHVGYLMRAGDVCAGYDLSEVRLVDDEAESLRGTDALPDRVVLRKLYRGAATAATTTTTTTSTRDSRVYKLQRLDVEKRTDADADAGGRRADKKKALKEMEQDDMDEEDFLRELDADREMRGQVNLYKAETTKKDDDAMDDAMDDDDGDDDQQVQLDELLDGLVLNDDEKKEEKIKEVFDEEAPWGLRNVVEEGEKAAEDGLKFVGREMARQVKDKDTATTVSTFGKDFMDKKFNFM